MFRMMLLIAWSALLLSCGLSTHQGAPIEPVEPPVATPVVALEEPDESPVATPVMALEEPDESPVATPVMVLEGSDESPVATPVVALEEPDESPVATPVVTLEEPDESPVATPVVTLEESDESPVAAAKDTPVSFFYPGPLWEGDSSLGLKLIYNDTVVKATMTSLSSEVVVVTDFYRDGTDSRYTPMLKFNLDVSEYLKGTGSTSTVAVWFNGRTYETRVEANDRLVEILAERDDRWDKREAIIFMVADPQITYGTVLDELFERDDHFFLSESDPFSDDDLYSLHSNRHRKWLPTTTITTADDNQQFLLDVPPTTETITLGALKQRIQEVSAELAADDGSKSYRRCLKEKYLHITNQRNWPQEMGSAYTSWKIDQDIVSGLAAGAILDRVPAGGAYPDSGDRFEIRLENRDAALFTFGYSAVTNVDTDRDGDFDEVTYDILVTLARPISRESTVSTSRNSSPTSRAATSWFPTSGP